MSGFEELQIENGVDKMDVSKEPAGLPCTECDRSDFRDKRALGVHRRMVHGVPGQSYSSQYEQRKKMGRPLGSKTKNKAVKNNKQVNVTEEEKGLEQIKERQREFEQHTAFVAGYITSFLETYAKGNGIPGDELASRVAEFLYAKKR